MANLSNIPKHNAALTGQQKVSDGVVFFAWLFWFTRPVFNTSLTAVTKHTGSLTSVPKH